MLVEKFNEVNSHIINLLLRHREERVDITYQDVLDIQQRLDKLIVDVAAAEIVINQLAVAEKENLWRESF